ncbi:transmembrane sensor [Duganella sp. 3397]|uniref:FecR domain-containing protein n=1 Tax=Duganella sp. 3397 TaxID=2817732 RepID=UPI00286271ED|nr:FecR domain-containing protein [Duganella sp. 3397]MDR7050919.1 transmembrane sensor [Duganella sp. 3397]
MNARPPSTDAAPAPRDAATVRKEAVGWYARLCSGSTTEADRAAWRQWQAAHPDHRRAWQRIEAMRATLLQVPANIAAPALRLTAQARSRRQALRGMALLASTGTLGYVAWRGASEHGFARPLLAEHRTGIGQQREVQLADGSLMVLDTATAVDVRFTATARVVQLWAGAVLIETAHQRQLQRQQAVDPRPFMVQTAQGSVTALGTRFTVRQVDGPLAGQPGGYTEVAVLEHAVAIRTADRQAVLLRAGQQARFTSTGVEAPQPVADYAGQWRSGHLLVNDRSLAEVLEELSRYRHGRLGCDPAVANLRISGVFPLTDTDRALVLLIRTFPLRQRSITRYWVTLGPR